MELYGSLWKTREYSIGKLGKREKEWPRVRYEKGRKELYKRRQSVTRREEAHITNAEQEPDIWI